MYLPRHVKYWANFLSLLHAVTEDVRDRFRSPTPVEEPGVYHIVGDQETKLCNQSNSRVQQSNDEFLREMNHQQVCVIVVWNGWGVCGQCGVGGYLGVWQCVHISCHKVW